MSSPEFNAELLSAYLDDEVTAAERALVEARLASDPAAGELLAELRAAANAVKGLPRQELDARFTTEVLAALDEPAAAAAGGPADGVTLGSQDVSFWRRPGVRRGITWASLAAAACVMLIVLQPEEPARELPRVAHTPPAKPQMNHSDQAKPPRMLADSDNPPKEAADESELLAAAEDRGSTFSEPMTSIGPEAAPTAKGFGGGGTSGEAAISVNESAALQSGSRSLSARVDGGGSGSLAAAPAKAPVLLYRIRARGDVEAARRALVETFAAAGIEMRPRSAVENEFIDAAFARIDGDTVQGDRDGYLAMVAVNDVAKLLGDLRSRAGDAAAIEDPATEAVPAAEAPATRTAGVIDNGASDDGTSSAPAGWAVALHEPAPSLARGAGVDEGPRRQDLRPASGSRGRFVQVVFLLEPPADADAP